MRDRRLYRILQQILIEVRSNRQYTQSLHLLLANAELGKQAGMTAPAKTAQKMREKLMAAKKEEEERTMRFLANRAAQGIGNGGLDITEEEARAIGRGEYMGPDDEGDE